MTRSTSECVTRARDKSTSHSSGSGGPLSKAKQWIKDPNLQYKQSKDKSTHSTQTQSHRFSTHEEEQRRTSSSSKSGSPQGDKGQNEQAYKGGDGGDE